MGRVLCDEAKGKKFGTVIDQYLQPLRVKIAHAVLDSGELTMIADDELGLEEVFKWLPLCKCIARHMLKNEFPKEFLPFLDAQGNPIVPAPDPINEAHRTRWDGYKNAKP